MLQLTMREIKCGGYVKGYPFIDWISNQRLYCMNNTAPVRPQGISTEFTPAILYILLLKDAPDGTEHNR